MYRGLNIPFQINANFGFGGAVLSILVMDMPSAYDDESTRTVIWGRQSQLLVQVGRLEA